MRELNLNDSLRVIWAYMNHLQFSNHPLATDIEADKTFHEATDKASKNVFEWELEIFTREALLHSELFPKRKTLKRWNTLINSIIKLRSLEEGISSHFIDQDSVLAEMFRMAHRLFPWQENSPNSAAIIRYFKIFSHPEVAPIVKKAMGIDIVQVYYLHLALLGAYLKSPAISLPVDITIKGFSKEQANTFISEFLRTPAQIRKDLIATQRYDDTYAYNNSVMRDFPLVLMRENGREVAICPCPTLLFWRASSGLYYKLINESGFDKAFGNSFQQYVGDVLRAGIDGQSFSVLQETPYQSAHGRKDSIDWIVDSPSSALFIECKAKRIPFTAKIALDVNLVREEIDKIARIIFQVYKTLKDYREGRYPHLSFDPNKKIYPLIVSLEEWYLFQGSFLGGNFNTALQDKVIEQFHQSGIPESWLEDMPYQMCSVAELEHVIQVIDEVGIEKFMEEKIRDKDKKSWQLRTYTATHFPDETDRATPLFDSEYEQLFAAFR